MFNFFSSKLPEKTKVVVAMSGGVDSSVVAANLFSLGYDVIGITLQLYDQGAMLAKKGACCAGQDIYDAKTVADKFGFPHYVLDYESKFSQRVIDDFADSYIRGETPLPCVRCNQSVKFQDLMQISKDLEADYLVTGHYVNIFNGKIKKELHKAKDYTKDQSYFLFATTQDQINYLQCPLGTMTKQETREMARSFGLNVADKPDSQDICFVPNGSYADLIKKIRPDAIKPGKIMHVDGFELGSHEGIINYTIGQRKGLKVAYGKPLYVTNLDPEKNIVYLGPIESLISHEILVKEFNWLGDVPVQENGMEVMVKLRSTHIGTDAVIYLLDDKYIRVKLPGGDKLVAAGQACVFYDNTRVLGGGWITRNIEK